MYMYAMHYHTADMTIVFYSIYQNMGQPLSKPDSFVRGRVHQSGSGGGVL